MPVLSRRLATLASLLLSAALLGACDQATSPLQPAAGQYVKKPASPTKYTFTGVTLTDADGNPLYENATIQATSKLVDHDSGTTVCGYFTAEGEYLGQFEAAEWKAADQIQGYCIDNFPDRSV
jgi:hypothetical protein